jgi:hypothetical protein
VLAGADENRDVFNLNSCSMEQAPPCPLPVRPPPSSIPFKELGSVQANRVISRMPRQHPGSALTVINSLCVVRIPTYPHDSHGLLFPTKNMLAVCDPRQYESVAIRSARAIRCRVHSTTGEHTVCVPPLSSCCLYTMLSGVLMLQSAAVMRSRLGAGKVHETSSLAPIWMENEKRRTQVFRRSYQRTSAWLDRLGSRAQKQGNFAEGFWQREEFRL